MNLIDVPLTVLVKKQTGKPPSFFFEFWFGPQSTTDDDLVA
ncbi:hypothetical protein D030_1156 [Vibrio parahaemolyticus AQ3810]|nr:hypothetical protein D030_1156 [Vibrio parahaemolyticus AQ3810]